jgi:hypothetical protein
MTVRLPLCCNGIFTNNVHTRSSQPCRPRESVPESDLSSDQSEDVGMLSNVEIVGILSVIQARVSDKPFVGNRASGVIVDVTQCVTLGKFSFIYACICTAPHALVPRAI